MDITVTFETLAAIVAAVPIITQWIKKLINKDLPGWINQVMAWGISIILCFIGWFFDLGILADTNWWQTLIIGIGIGLAANGVFDLNFIRQLLDLIFGKIGIEVKKEETTTEKS